jgi:hypothetical protein
MKLIGYLRAQAMPRNKAALILVNDLLSPLDAQLLLTDETEPVFHSCACVISSHENDLLRLVTSTNMKREAASESRGCNSESDERPAKVPRRGSSSTNPRLLKLEQDLSRVQPPLSPLSPDCNSEVGLQARPLVAI